MSSIVIFLIYFLIFFIKVSVPAPFRHRYRFKSIGYVPVSDKNQTIPIPIRSTIWAIGLKTEKLSGPLHLTQLGDI